MADWEVSQLPVVTSVASNDRLPLLDVDGTTPPAGAGGSDATITMANLAAAFASLSSSLVAVPVSGDTTGATDTAAINAVCQAGKTAWLGPGTYYITHLLPDSYGGIVGSGAATVLQVVAGTTGYAIALLHPATTAQVTLARFRLNCNQVCGGIQLDNTGFTPIASFVPYDPLHQCSDVFVLGASGDAWHLDNNARGLSFFNCRQYFASGYGFYLGPGAGASGAGCTDGNFTGCISGPSGNHGYFVAAGSSDNMFQGCKAFYSGYNEGTATWGTTQCGFEVQGNWNTFVGCNAQQAALHGFDFQSCNYNAMAGCDADTNSAGASVTTGVGLNVNACQYSSFVGTAGFNNSGLTPGAQLFGYQVNGNNTGSLFYGNSVQGSSGGFNYAGGFGSQVFDYNTVGMWGASIAQAPSWTYSTYGTTQSLSNGSTIVNGVVSTGANFAIYPVSSTANVSGLVLAAPPNGAGTAVTVVNTTAFTLQFAASGTSNVADGASDVIGPGAQRTYLYDGTLWRRDTAAVYTGTNGLPQATTPAGLASYVQQSQAAATSPVTVTAASITSLGALSVPANDPVAGAKYKLTAHGTLGTASSAPTATVDLRWGGTAGTLLMSLVTGTSAPALTASLSAVPVTIEGEIEFITSTTVTGWLRLTWRNSATATTAATVALASVTSAVTVTTSAAESFTLDWTWSATGTGTTITIASSSFERVA